MKRILVIFLFALQQIYGQNNMKPIDQLIDITDPAWPVLQKEIAKAKNKVEILPVDKTKSKNALYYVQVTTHSTLGAIIYETGGLLIENGWIRVLGSGSNKLNRSLPEWNLGKTFDKLGSATPYWLVADDAVGGFFLLNGGGLGQDVGNVYYLSPDTLEYESLGFGYSSFINFCLNGNVAGFYDGLRWKDWEKDILLLSTDKVFSFYPYLWTKEGKDIDKSSRKPVPVEEHYGLIMNFRKQLGLN